MSGFSGGSGYSGPAGGNAGLRLWFDNIQSDMTIPTVIYSDLTWTNSGTNDYVETAAGNFVTDGWVVGRKVKVTGASVVLNNGTWSIKTVTTSRITFTSAGSITSDSDVGIPVTFQTDRETLTRTPVIGIEEDESIALVAADGSVCIDNYCTVTGVPGVAAIPAGLWTMSGVFWVSSTSSTVVTAKFAVRSVTTAGVITEHGTSSTAIITATSNATAQRLSMTWANVADIAIATTDRIIVRVQFNNDSGTSRTAHFIYQGTTRPSYVDTTFNVTAPSGLSGFSGWSGESGVSGWSGDSTSGWSGVSGLSTSGWSGWSGVSGTGTSGWSGVSGVGTSGTSGTSGAMGDSGYSGAAGTSAPDAVYSSVSGASGASGTVPMTVSVYSGSRYFLHFWQLGSRGTSWSAAFPTCSYRVANQADNNVLSKTGESVNEYTASFVPSEDGSVSFKLTNGLGSLYDIGLWMTTDLAGSGYSGQVGSSGTSGQSGWSGVSGGSGQSGWSGVSGIGTSGWSGVSGLSTSGWSGVSSLSGASGQSGFSGGGSVVGTTWSSVSGYLALAAGLGILADTSPAAFSAMLPGSPSNGDTISFMDMKGTWATNNLRIVRNGKNIQNSATDLDCNVNNASFDLVYGVDGWKLKDRLYL